MNALKDWLPEFSRQKTVWGPMSKPQVGLTQPTALVPGVNTCKFVFLRQYFLALLNITLALLIIDCLSSVLLRISIASH